MQRRTRWYLRAKVPVDLVATLGRSEVWRSLGTGDHAVAVKLYRRARANLDDWFDQQRRRRDAGEKLFGQLPQMVAGWLRESDRRAAHLDFGLVGDLLHTAQAEAQQELFDLLEDGADEAVAAAADQVLLGNGWPARPHVVGSIATRRTKTADGGRPASIHDLARRTLIEAARRRLDRRQGKPNGGYDPLFTSATSVQPVASSGATHLATSTTGSRSAS